MDEIYSRKVDASIPVSAISGLSAPAQSLLTFCVDYAHRFKGHYPTVKNIRVSSGGGNRKLKKIVAELSKSGLVTIRGKGLNLLSDDTEIIPTGKATAGRSKDVKRESGTVYVYLMVDRNTGMTKIGCSNNPKVRERTLQSEKPTIEMIGKWPGSMALEKQLHKKYKTKRVRGEWFRLTDADKKDVRDFMLSH